jgi:hypothetical protein
MQFVYSPQTFQEASFIDAAIRQFIVLKQCWRAGEVFYNAAWIQPTLDI